MTNFALAFKNKKIFLKIQESELSLSRVHLAYEKKNIYIQISISSELIIKRKVLSSNSEKMTIKKKRNNLLIHHSIERKTNP